MISPESDERLKALLRRELGPLIVEGLEDSNVVEILQNPDGSCWVDRHSSGLERVGQHDLSQIEALTSTIATYYGRVFTAESPTLEASLPFHGARFTAVRPPLSSAVLFSIRKRRQYDLSRDFVKRGILSDEHALFLVNAIQRRSNLIICGGPGTGKTALANALLLATETRRRIFILEDNPELDVARGLHAVPLLTSYTHDLAALVRVTQRLRPDAICIGELRGPEAAALVNAWNSGIRGGLTTLHADDSPSALSKLELLIRSSGIPFEDIAKQLIAMAVDLIVLIEGRNLERQVAEITKLTGFDEHTQTYQLSYLLRKEPNHAN